ncbi:MAG: SMC-Scp complex subunit ScpB [Candidatus Delongbacteria bacterium]|nr:SMC-Scp complex subunit ScpB [Candidatus Delongbacteria bacterium]
MKSNELKSVVEALIFAGDSPVDDETIHQILGNGFKPQDIAEMVDELNREYTETERAFRIEKIAGGYCLTTRREYHHFVKQLYRSRLNTRLSSSGMECLAIIAVKQPITRIEIEKIRGVNCSASLNTLLERDLIMIRGKKRAPGNPVLYGTTEAFLKYLGINRLEDLPNYDLIRQSILNLQPPSEEWTEETHHEMQTE